MLHYDPVDGRLLRLCLVELHEGIVRRGYFCVSCADFADEDGRTYDLDFLVVHDASGYRVNQAIVHAVAGEKRRYHVCSDLRLATRLRPRLRARTMRCGWAFPGASWTRTAPARPSIDSRRS